MAVLALAFAALAGFLILAYFQLPLVVWTAAVGLLFWWVSALADFGVVGNTILFAPFAIAALALNVPFLRRAILTNHVLAVYRRILPDMSQTEKEAIDAGTVWWDADLFSGKPDWPKLLAVPEPRLSPEEQAFLDGPVEELCAMCDEWAITHEHLDLPPQ